MNLLRRSFLVAAWVAALSVAAQAQATKPTTKPAAKPVRLANPAKASDTAEPSGVGVNAVDLSTGLRNRYGYGVVCYGGNPLVSPISLSYELGAVQLGPGVLGLSV